LSRDPPATVEFEHRLERVGPRAPELDQYVLDDRGNVEESDAAAEKSCDGDLVGGTEYGRGAAARAQGVASYAQRREAFGVGGGELEPGERCEV
jgi:hypothetical protein